MGRRQKIALAIPAFKGVVQSHARGVSRKAGVDLTQRAGQCTEDAVERAYDHHHAESTTAQDRRLVLEQTEGCKGQEV